MMKRLPLSGRALVLLSAAIGAAGTIAVVTTSATAHGTAGPFGSALQTRGSHVVRTTATHAFASTIRGFATSGVAAPPSAAAELATLSGHGNGAVDAAGARQMFPGATGVPAFYAASSSTGELCYLIAGGPAGCAAPFTQQLPVNANIYDADGFGVGSPTIVAGLAPSDVTSISVESAAGEREAFLSNNVFFVRVPGSAIATALHIGYADGTQLTMELPTPS
jgi:hypothetical protein